MLFEERKVADGAEPVTVIAGASLAFGPQPTCFPLPTA